VEDGWVRERERGREGGERKRKARAFSQCSRCWGEKKQVTVVGVELGPISKREREIRMQMGCLHFFLNFRVPPSSLSVSLSLVCVRGIENDEERCTGGGGSLCRTFPSFGHGNYRKNQRLTSTTTKCPPSFFSPLQCIA